MSKKIIKSATIELSKGDRALLEQCLANENSAQLDATLDRAIRELREGKGVSLDEVRKRIDEWTLK